MFSRFDTVPAYDGQTDRRTDGRPAYIYYVHASASDARKNWYVNGKSLKIVYHLTSRVPVGPNQGQTCQIAKWGFGLSCQNP